MYGCRHPYIRVDVWKQTPRVPGCSVNGRPTRYLRSRVHGHRRCLKHLQEEVPERVAPGTRTSRTMQRVLHARWTRPHFRQCHGQARDRRLGIRLAVVMLPDKHAQTQSTGSELSARQLTMCRHGQVEPNRDNITITNLDLSCYCLSNVMRTRLSTLFSVRSAHP